MQLVGGKVRPLGLGLYPLSVLVAYAGQDGNVCEYRRSKDRHFPAVLSPVHISVERRDITSHHFTFSINKKFPF